MMGEAASETGDALRGLAWASGFELSVNGRAHYPPSSSILPPFSKSAAVANFCHLCPPQRIRPPWRPRLPILGGASGLGSYILLSSKTISLRINNVMGWKLSLWAGRQVGKYAERLLAVAKRWAKVLI